MRGNTDAFGSVKTCLAISTFATGEQLALRREKKAVIKTIG